MHTRSREVHHSVNCTTCRGADCFRSVRPIVVDGPVSKDYLVLGWAYCDIVSFHEGGPCQYIYIEIFNDKAFKGKRPVFTGER